MATIGILNYGVGNIRSVANAVSKVGFQAELITEPEVIANYDHIIAPGVGNFGFVVDQFRAVGFEDAVIDYVKSGKFYLGICVGMQMLFASSDESVDVSGLGFLAGKVEKMSTEDSSNSGKPLKLPHIGWSQLAFESESTVITKLFSGLTREELFYFVHSYTAKPEIGAQLNASTRYGDNKISAVVSQDNIIGTQFHPERSGVAGLRLVENFCNL